MKYKDRVKASKEYGLFKFKVPSIEERNAAIDMSGEGTLFKKLILTDINSFYKPISPPNQNEKINDNWLLSHKEYGQTYTEFIRTKSYYPLTIKNSKIYLVYLQFTKKVLNQKIEGKERIEKVEKNENINESEELEDEKKIEQDEARDTINENNDNNYNNDTNYNNENNYNNDTNYNNENNYNKDTNYNNENNYNNDTNYNNNTNINNYNENIENENNINEESNNNINSNLIYSKKSINDNTEYNLTKTIKKTIYVEEDFDMIINIPESINQNILNIYINNDFKLFFSNGNRINYFKCSNWKFNI